MAAYGLDILTLYKDRKDENDVLQVLIQKYGLAPLNDYTDRSIIRLYDAKDAIFKTARSHIDRASALLSE